MSDTVELKISLKDLASGVASRMGTNFGHVFSDIDKGIGAIGSKLQGLGKPVKLEVDTSDIRRAGDEVKGLRDRLGFFKTAGAMALGNLVGRGLEMGVRKVAELGGSAYDQGKNIENMDTALETFVSPEKARFIVNRVVTEGALTPYTTQQLLPIEQGLIASGGIDPNRAHRDTWALANAVAVTNPGNDYALERMGVMHLAQIAASGHLEGMQRREFTLARIPIDKILSQYLHVPQAQIKDMPAGAEYYTGTYDSTRHGAGVQNTIYALQDVNVYPNPTPDELHVTYTSLTGQPIALRLTAITGQCVQTVRIEKPVPGMNEANISVAALPQGIYFLQLQQGSNLVNKKISVMR